MITMTMFFYSYKHLLYQRTCMKSFIRYNCALVLYVSLSTCSEPPSQELLFGFVTHQKNEAEAERDFAITQREHAIKRLTFVQQYNDELQKKLCTKNSVIENLQMQLEQAFIIAALQRKQTQRMNVAPPRASNQSSYKDSPNYKLLQQQQKERQAQRKKM